MTPCRAGGAGLGLAMVRGIVLLVHSDLAVEGTPGVASQFTFRLP